MPRPVEAFFGIGGQAPDARAQVVLTGLQPMPPGRHGGRSSFEAAAHEDGDGFPGAWRLRVYAVCASPLPGLTYRQASAPVSSAITAAEMVLCPAGKVVLGGGGGHVALTEHGLQMDNAFATAYEDENGIPATARRSPKRLAEEERAPLPGRRVPHP
ncbi:hypothetical protein [Nonomuraea rosea]|uniref:hypothetical protein n=1 Tax=Nonomuraea rosea TaxID=638574 RepID=UPI0031EA1861